MKHFTTICLALLLAVAVSAAGDITKEFPMKMGKQLVVDLESGGSITITGWDRELVRIEVNTKYIDPEDLRLDFDERTDGLEIVARERRWGRSRKSSVDFLVKVPNKCDLELESMGGSFTISGVEGVIEGKTMGGSLDLSDLKGKVDLHTMGGDITLANSDVDGKVHTNGGDVTLRDVVGNVKGSSLGGPVTYRNVTDRRGKGTGDVVKISTMGGPIRVDDAPGGADLNTLGGDIRIRSAADFVNATTLGGDIWIDAIDGSVDASTLGGDVEVTMVGDPSKGERDVELSSLSGDVVLTVPKGLSMDIDVTIQYTRNSKKPKIVSDFSLEEEETKEWDYDEGSPRKYIYGTGKVGDGKHRVRIKTINGNVYLREG